MASNLTVIDNIIPALLVHAVPSPPVLVMGYNKPDDGGGGLFRLVPGDTTPPDGGMVFASRVHRANGRWRRVVDVGYVSVKWFGAKGDRTMKDGPAITRAIAYATGGDDPATHPRAARAAVYLLPASTASMPQTAPSACSSDRCRASDSSATDQIFPCCGSLTD